MLNTTAGRVGIGIWGLLRDAPLLSLQWPKYNQVEPSYLWLIFAENRHCRAQIAAFLVYDDSTLGPS